MIILPPKAATSKGNVLSKCPRRAEQLFATPSEREFVGSCKPSRFGGPPDIADDRSCIFRPKSAT